MKKLIITHMGSPETPDQIPEFLKNIFLDRNMMKLPLQGLSGRILAKLREPEAKKHYQKAGGSPLLKITNSLADKLRKKFIDIEIDVRFTHSRPYLEDSYPEGTAIFPLYPQYSAALTGAIEKKFPQVKVLKNYHKEPEFIDCLKKRTQEVLNLLEKDETLLLFVAHSVPASLIERGDTYKEQTEEMAGLLAGQFKGYETKLGYIGKAGPKKRIGPEAKDIIAECSKKNIVCLYLSLPIDNLEILYDIDIELANTAKIKGIEKFVRVKMPNDEDDFADAVEKIIRRNLL